MATLLDICLLLLHLISTGHDQELHVPGHLGVGVGHDVLLEGGVQPSEHGLDVSSCGWIVWVEVYQSLVQVSVLNLRRLHLTIQVESIRYFATTKLIFSK